MNNENNNLMGNGLNNNGVNGQNVPNNTNDLNQVIPGSQVVLPENQAVVEPPKPVENPSVNQVVMPGVAGMPVNEVASPAPTNANVVAPNNQANQMYNASQNQNVGSVNPTAQSAPTSVQNPQMNPSPMPNLGNVNPNPTPTPSVPNNGGQAMGSVGLGVGGVSPVGPSFENPGAIGTNPPPLTQKEEKPKKKKGMNKTLFVVLIIVVIAAVGGGVYWYLNLAQEPDIKVELKDIAYDLNDEVSNDIASYATITGTNSSNCLLDTSKIDTKKVGQYEYTVTCGKDVYKGKALVSDSSGPVVSTLSVTKTVNSSISPADFVAACYDNTSCTYKFEDESAVNALLANAGGPTKVTIVATDESNNETKVEANLTVISDEIRAYYDCTSKEQDVTDIKAKMTETHTLGILKTTASDGSLAFGNFGTVTYMYVFEDEKAYNEVAEKFKNDKKVTIGEVSGIPILNDENKAIIIKADLNVDSLKTVYGQDKYTSSKTISDLYKNTLGYTCSTKSATSNNTSITTTDTEN